MTKPVDERSICENRRVRHEYEILDTVEAGIALVGSEVKSLRAGQASLAEAWVGFEGGQAWLIDAHIAPYAWANRNNHEPRRKRKLLLHKAELLRWDQKVREKGLTALPLRMYFKGPHVKVEVGLGRGKKLHDKRATLKERSDRREIERALKATD